MSDSTIPHRATFIRDRLAEWLEGLGHDVTATDERDGFPCLSVETWDGATFDDVAVTTDGRMMSMIDGWREVRLRGFTWTPEPTDTGERHGPWNAILVHRFEGYGGWCWIVRDAFLRDATADEIARALDDHPDHVRMIGQRVPGTNRTV